MHLYHYSAYWFSFFFIKFVLNDDVPFSSDCTICGNQLGSIGKGTAYGVRTVCRPCARWLQVWVKPLYEKNNENWQHGFGPCQHSDGNCVITGENRLNCFPCTLTKAVQNGLTYDVKFPYIRTYYICSIFFFWEPFFYEDCSIILQLEKNPRKFSMYCCTKCLARPVPFAKGPSRENFTDDSLTIHADDFFIPKRKKFETNRPDLLRKNTPVLKLLTWVKLISSFRNNSHFSVK